MPSTTSVTLLHGNTERNYCKLYNAIIGHVWPKAIGVVNSMFVKFQQHCVAILTNVIAVVITALVITYDAITDIQENRCRVQSSEATVGGL